MDTITINEESAYNQLLAEIKASGKEYNMICFVGRGGLSVVQKLAYELDIEQIKQWSEPIVHVYRHYSILFVDDISCTGKTLMQVSHPKMDTATLVTRGSTKMKPTYTGVVSNTSAYIKFSWEK